MSGLRQALNRVPFQKRKEKREERKGKRENTPQNLPEEPPLITSKVMMGNAQHWHPGSPSFQQQCSIKRNGIVCGEGKNQSMTNYVRDHTRYSRDPYLFFSRTIGKKHYLQHL